MMKLFYKVFPGILIQFVYYVFKSWRWIKIQFSIKYTLHFVASLLSPFFLNQLFKYRKIRKVKITNIRLLIYKYPSSDLQIWFKRGLGSNEFNINTSEIKLTLYSSCTDIIKQSHHLLQNICLTNILNTEFIVKIKEYERYCKGLIQSSFIDYPQFTMEFNIFVTSFLHSVFDGFSIYKPNKA